METGSDAGSVGSAAEKPRSMQHLSDMPAATIEGISAETRRALTEHMKFTFMTQVQKATLPDIIAGKDVVAKAKTGTGKTVAFLLPTLDRLAQRARANQAPPNRRDIAVLVLSPTRELASQIEREADALLKFQPPGAVNVEVMFGGTPLPRDLKRFADPRPIDVLVTTPGRLQDHITNAPDVGNRLARGVRVLILDEADRLLDMGFRPAIERIVRTLPAARQTLLFSATLPPALNQMLGMGGGGAAAASSALVRPGYVVIDTVGEEEDSERAVVNVPQDGVVVALDRQLAALDNIIRQHVAECRAANTKFKVIVFFAAARLAGFTANVIEASKPGYTVLEIHSRLSQAKRTRTSDQFRDGSNVVLFSSDVSARGLDYPDVTLVVQCGLTERDSYIHRVGRTARAGRSGLGVLMVTPFEERALKQRLRDLPIKWDAAVSPAVAAAANAPCRPELTATIASVGDPRNELNRTAAQAYVGFLGFYNSNLKAIGMDKPALVALANQYAGFIGLQEIPALEAKTVGMMGMKGVPGLVVNRGGGGGGGGGRQQQPQQPRQQQQQQQPQQPQQPRPQQPPQQPQQPRPQQQQQQQQPRRGGFGGGGGGRGGSRGGGFGGGGGGFTPRA